MQDSSQNPYIPQESEAIRQKVYERQTPLDRIVKWSLIATVIIAVLVGVGLYFVIPRTTAVDKEARVKFANVLQAPDQVHKRVHVTSDLGFNLEYDNRVYSSYAEVGDSSSGSDSSAAVLSGQTYENNELRTARAYNYIRIRPIESVDTARALAPIPPQLELFATVSEQDLTKAAAVPENKGLSKLSLFVKLDGDRRAAKKVADDKTVVNIEATKQVSATVGSVEYQKVRYTTTNDNHRVSNVKYDECYYTIQFDQPYSICISNVRPSNVSAASLVEAVFESVSFEESSVASETSSPASAEVPTKKNAYAYPLARLAQSVTAPEKKAEASGEANAVTLDEEEKETPLVTVTPEYYTNEASLKSIATAQPSVVRIGSLYCADLSLKFESGNTATTLTDACTGNVASGVIISKDGYIATTANAIRANKKEAINGYINFAPVQSQMLDRLQRILDYLLKAKIILQSDADYLKTGASIGDQEALAKVQNIASVIPDDFITPLKEEYTYAVQPTDKPIVINKSDAYKPSFAYSDSVLKATYVASDNGAKGLSGEGNTKPGDSSSQSTTFATAAQASDTGLLKVDGAFQEVTIASDTNVKANDNLHTVGYPAYTDSSLTIDKMRNIPIVTTSKVEQAYEKDGGKLIQTNMPVLPGNDGAPVMDSSGQLIGFAVYGQSFCPDQLCFANGTVRTSAELMKLVREENIDLQTGSESKETWERGVDEYMRANYTASTDAFAAASKLYPYNRWAPQMQQLSSSLRGSSQDTSTMNLLQQVMIASLIILGALTSLLAVTRFIHKRRTSMLQVGHYGYGQEAAASAPVHNPNVPVAQPPVSQPIIPQVQPQLPTPPQQYVGPQPSGSYPASQPNVSSQPTGIPVQHIQTNQLPQQGTQPQQKISEQPEDPFYK